MTTEAKIVVVIGSGLAGLCSAISAVEHGSKVLVIEKAPYDLRGGNGRLAGGGFKVAHYGEPMLRKESFTPDEYYSYLMRISRGRGNSKLIRTVVEGSLDIIPWLTKQGLEWEVTDKEDHYPDEPMVKGRGPAMIDHLIHAAELKGVLIQYDIALEGLLTDEKGGVVGAKLVTKSGISKIECGAVILASGGFQASSEMRAKYLGAEEATMLVRGTSYDTGEGITIAMAAGAQAVGDWGGYHGTMAHISSPLSGGGIIMVPNYSHGILVNKMGKRIVDEASDYMYNTYAMLGRIVLRQPQGRVFFIFDAETVKHSGHRAGRVLEPVQAPTIRELAVKAGIDPEGLVRTVEEFNAAVQQGPYDPYELDGKHTSGIEPPKSNWAMPIDKPPFYSHEHVTGITFTYGGIKVNEKSEVLDSLNNPIPGLYAAGDIVGDYFYYNYGGGTGTTRCAVQGRIAGKNAAAFTGKG